MTEKFYEGPPHHAREVFSSTRGLSIYAVDGFKGFGGSRLLAENNRPLGERNAHPIAILSAEEAGQSLNHSPSIFLDSRAGHVENRPALNDITARYPIVLSNIAWVRQKLVKKIPELDTPDVTLGMFEDIAVITDAVAPYIINRARSPYGPHGAPIPLDLADLGKVAAGVHAGAFAAYFDPRTNKGKISAEAMYTYADIARLLTADDRSCPAPPQMIKTVVAIMLGEDVRGMTNVPESTLARYNIDFAGLIDFAHTTDIDRRLYNAIQNVLLQLEEDRHVVKSEQQVKRETLTLIEEHIAALNQLQRRVNLSLGRDPLSAPPVTLDILKENEHYLKEDIERLLE